MERNEVIQMRVSPKEKAEMGEKARSIGMTVSEWLRKLAMEWRR